MLIYRLFPFILSLLAVGACHPTASELKVIESQRTEFKACVVSTITEAYANSKPPLEAVEAFANEMSRRAPTSNKTAIDPAFTDYVTKYGCDPSKDTGKNTVGNMLVAEWFVSPFNPNLLSNTGPKLNPSPKQNP
jgi:hypothetical protein